MAVDVTKSSRPGLPRLGRLAGLRIPIWAGVTLVAVVAGTSLALALLSPLASDGINCITIVVIALLLSYRPRRADPLKRALRLLTWALGAAFVASGMNVVCELVTGHPPSHPWAGDAVAFLYVPFTVAALLLVPAASQRTGYRARALADGIVASSCLWYLIVIAGNHLAPSAGHGGWDIAGFAVAAGDVCVVATALTVLARCSAPMTPIVGGIAVGVTVLSVNDVSLAISGQGAYGVRPVLMFQFGLLLLAAAAALPGPQSDQATRWFARVRWTLGSAPFLPLLVCIVVTVAIAAGGGGLRQSEVVPALCLVVALVARQYVGSRDKQRLVDRLREREFGLQAALRRDALTGLGNRLALMERLSAVLGDRRQWPVAVALLDLNEFKLINDNHGHAVGDQVLCQAAERLARTELDQFHVHYQPIVELATGRTRGFEALLRWDHPDMGGIPPDVFIPLAERAGSVDVLGRHVLMTAATDMARLGWRRPDERLFVSVNVSPRELVRDGFADSVLTTLNACGLPPEQLMLEVTEQAFTADLTPVVAELARLSGAGVTIAIDDFGTGYSTLRYVRRLRPGTIKIGRSFIVELPDHEAACRLVDAVQTIAEMLELRTAAEGIETEAQLRFLRGIGCELGQGYLFSAAVPAEEMEPLLAEGDAASRAGSAIRPA
jgi:EAL domain-containing protein (putative c-di-GMP-specific phosphodiesterase class I)